MNNSLPMPQKREKLLLLSSRSSWMRSYRTFLRLWSRPQLAAKPKLWLEISALQCCKASSNCDFSSSSSNQASNPMFSRGSGENFGKSLTQSGLSSGKQIRKTHSFPRKSAFFIILILVSFFHKLGLPNLMMDRNIL